MGVAVEMDSAFHYLCEVRPGLDTWRFRVRVLRMWPTYSFMKPNEINSLEFVFMDEKGGKIHASVRRQLIYLFENKLKEGDFYKISHFTVAPSVGGYRPTLHPYKLLFQMKSKVQSCQDVDIPPFGFSFTDLSEVSSYRTEYDYLIDVIGLMSGISNEREYIRDGKVTKMVVLELTDLSGKCECALFGDYVDELKSLIAKSSSGMHVVAIQFAKVKIFRERASIQNVMNTTRIFIDPDIKEFGDLRKGLCHDETQTPSLITLIGPRVRPSFEDDFLNMQPKKTIEQLDSLDEEGTFIVSAVIDGFAEGEDWWYPACKCYRSVTPDSGAFYCKGCVKHVYVTIPRYRVKVYASDGTSGAAFVIFDGDMQYLIDQQCSSLVSTAKGENGGFYPEEIYSLKGMRLLLKVEKQISQGGRFDGSYRVRRVCKEVDIVEAFCVKETVYSPSQWTSNCDSSPTKVANKEVDYSESSEAVKFADELFSIPQDLDNVNSTPDLAAVVNLGDDTDSDVTVGPSAAKRKRNKKYNGRSLKRNLNDDFDEEDSYKTSGFLKNIKNEKD